MDQGNSEMVKSKVMDLDSRDDIKKISIFWLEDLADRRPVC